MQPNISDLARAPTLVAGCGPNLLPVITLALEYFIAGIAFDFDLAVLSIYHDGVRANFT